MSDDHIYHSFKPQIIIDILAMIGGFLSAFTKKLTHVVGKLNKQIMRAKFIRSIYFLKKLKDKIPKLKLVGWNSFLE